MTAMTTAQKAELKWFSIGFVFWVSFFAAFVCVVPWTFSIVSVERGMELWPDQVDPSWAAVQRNKGMPPTEFKLGLPRSRPLLYGAGLVWLFGSLAGFVYCTNRAKAEARKASS
jgi:hypothetical protein